MSIVIHLYSKPLSLFSLHLITWGMISNFGNQVSGTGVENVISSTATFRHSGNFWHLFSPTSLHTLLPVINLLHSKSPRSSSSSSLASSSRNHVSNSTKDFVRWTFESSVYEPKHHASYFSPSNVDTTFAESESHKLQELEPQQQLPDRNRFIRPRIRYRAATKEGIALPTQRDSTDGNVTYPRRLSDNIDRDRGGNRGSSSSQENIPVKDRPSKESHDFIGLSRSKQESPTAIEKLFMPEVPKLPDLSLPWNTSSMKDATTTPRQQLTEWWAALSSNATTPSTRVPRNRSSWLEEYRKQWENPKEPLPTSTMMSTSSRQSTQSSPPSSPQSQYLLVPNVSDMRCFPGPLFHDCLELCFEESRKYEQPSPLFQGEQGPSMEAGGVSSLSRCVGDCRSEYIDSTIPGCVTSSGKIIPGAPLNNFDGKIYPDGVRRPGTFSYYFNRYIHRFFEDQFLRQSIDLLIAAAFFSGLILLVIHQSEAITTRFPTVDGFVERTRLHEFFNWIVEKARAVTVSRTLEGERDLERCGDDNGDFHAASATALLAQHMQNEPSKSSESGSSM